LQITLLLFFLLEIMNLNGKLLKTEIIQMGLCSLSIIFNLLVFDEVLDVVSLLMLVVLLLLKLEILLLLIYLSLLEVLELLGIL
jgi:hypothetical protein